MRRIGLLAVILASTLSTAPAAQSRAEARFALEISGDAGFHALVLPPAIYAESRAAGLTDLVVRNGAGERVPFALETTRPAPPEVSVETREVRWFEVPLPDETGTAPEIALAIRPDGTLAATGTPVPPGRSRRIDVIDLGAARDRIRALRFELAPTPHQGRVKIEAGGDLEHWTPIAEATLTRLGDGPDVLERTDVDLATGGARYLRLRWIDPAPTLRRLSVVHGVRAPEPVRDHTRGLPARAAGPGLYDFDTGGRYPVDRLTVHPPQANTVAAVRLYSRPEASAAWRFVWAGKVVSVKTGGGAETAEPAAFTPSDDRLWRLEVDMRAGGFGTGEPTVDIGWRPATLTFLARGAGPFEVAVGGVHPVSGEMSKAALLPKGDVVVGTARLGARLEPVAAAGRGSEGNGRDAFLWAALIVAVAFLGFMAWRMMKDPPPADPTAPPA